MILTSAPFSPPSVDTSDVEMAKKSTRPKSRNHDILLIIMFQATICAEKNLF